MNEEMVTYQKKFKENIQYLINQNKLKEAKELLSEYERRDTGTGLLSPIVT